MCVIYLRNDEQSEQRGAKFFQITDKPDYERSSGMPAPTGRWWCASARASVSQCFATDPAGRITLKFGVLLEINWLCFSHYLGGGASACAHTFSVSQERLDGLR